MWSMLECYEPDKTFCSQSSIDVTCNLLGVCHIPYLWVLLALVVYAGVGRCWKIMDRTRHTSICDRSYLDAVFSKQITVSSYLRKLRRAICRPHVAESTSCELTICGAQVYLRAVYYIPTCNCATITSRTHPSATCGKLNCIICGSATGGKPQFAGPQLAENLIPQIADQCACEVIAANDNQFVRM